MDEPPRRRRPVQASGASLPLIPVLIGVIVAGFAIGAGISILRQRGDTTTNVVVVKTPVPRPAATPAETLTPVAAVTLPPNATPRPRASVPQRPVPKRTAFAGAAPTASPLELQSPVAVTTPLRATLPPERAEARPRASARAATARETQAPRVAQNPPPVTITAAPTVPPAPRPIASARPAPSPTPVPPATEDADSAFARLGVGVVRAYLNALARGDDASAQAMLGANPNTREGSLGEKAFVDSSMRIVTLDGRSTGNDTATVSADISTSRGVYFARYFIRRNNAGAAVIADHDFIKP